MEENKTNLKDLTAEQKLDFIRKLNDNRDVLVAQAEVAEARARILKAQLEELAYTMKIQDLKNPPEQNEQSKSQAGAKES